MFEQRIINLYDQMIMNTGGLPCHAIRYVTLFCQMHQQ